LVITIAGNGVQGYSGDGGPALSAELVRGDMNISANGTVTYVDGDKVSVAVSLGMLTSGLFTMKGIGAGEQLHQVQRLKWWTTMFRSNSTDNKPFTRR
jgi:hypothetical protein